MVKVPMLTDTDGIRDIITYKSLWAYASEEYVDLFLADFPDNKMALTLKDVYINKRMKTPNG